MRRTADSKLDIGQKIDKVTLLSVEKTYDNRHRTVYLWTCKCDCGNICTIQERSLLKSNFHSCGCFQRKYLIPGDINRASAAGKARAKKRNKNECNVDMLFRDKTISTNTSGIQGISFCKTNHKWHVYIGYQNRRATLGYFEDIEDAKRIRNLGLQAVKNGTFEQFFKDIRGKDYKATYKYNKNSSS